MKGFKLVAALVIFNLATLVSAAVGFMGPYEGGIIKTFVGVLGDPQMILGLAGVFGVFAVLAKSGITVNLGSVLFTGLFAGFIVQFNVIFGSFVNAGYMPSILQTFFHFPLYMVMAFALIQLSSQSADQGL